MVNIKYRRELGQVVGVPGNAAEIGVAEGYFSADILRMSVHFPTVYMVDRWKSNPTQRGDASNPQEWHDRNLAQARARVAEFGERAVFLQGSSVEMALRVPNQSLALLYIDGDHSYSGVLADVQAWLPKVAPGGVVGFHDYLAMQYGVHAAVNDFCANRFEIHVLTEDKPEDAGAYFINIPC